MRHTGARRADEQHADGVGAEGPDAVAAELALLELLDAGLEALNDALQALDLVLDDTHGGDGGRLQGPIRGTMVKDWREERSGRGRGGEHGRQANWQVLQEE